VKTVFGAWWQRLLGSSATLSPFEVALLEAVVRSLSEPLRPLVEAQIEAATLVQRYRVRASSRAEWRGLLFYQGPVPSGSGVKPLPVEDGTVELPVLKVRVGPDGPLLTITAHAHRRHFFDIMSNKDWCPVRHITDLRVEAVSLQRR
jgi:hypothetical protein